MQFKFNPPEMSAWNPSQEGAAIPKQLNGDSCLDSIKFKISENQIIGALPLRGNDQENIDQAIIDCATDYDESSWPELFDYFQKIEQELTSKNITCSKCQQFKPDSIGDGSGIGSCATGINRPGLLWSGQQACTQVQVFSGE